MGHIYDEITDAARAANIDVVALPSGESRTYLERLSQKYANGTLDWLWEHVANGLSIRDPDAWKWINEYTAGKQTLMLFNQRDEQIGFYFADGSHIVPILAETSGFEFYLTDKNLTFFLCFNHHDYLVAAGSASGWIKQKIDSPDMDYQM